MRLVAGVVISAVSLCLVAGGCAQNPFAPAPQAAALPNPQQNQVIAREGEMLAQAKKLERDNQEMSSLLAQTQQKSKLAEDRAAALQEQLNQTTAQLAQSRDDKTLTEQRAQALTASARLRGTPTITANNSLKQQLDRLNIPGLEKRIDGDVIRIELPSEKIFDYGTARLSNGANIILENAGTEIARVFPRQIVGIEGHTDRDPQSGLQSTANHQLSFAQASTVFVFLSQRTIPANQLFLAAHGGNHPVASNGSLNGKARNRRVELVIYPDQVAPGQ